MAIETSPSYTSGPFVGPYFNMPLEASTTVYSQELVAYNASTGNIVPVQDTAGLVFAGQIYGVSGGSATSGTVAGSISVPVIPPVAISAAGGAAGLLPLAITGATQALCGTTVYFVDDHTVATSTSHSVVAGIVRFVQSATQVWVDVTATA